MMSAILDRDKLAKVLGVLGSAHAGEIAAAGRTAHLLIREAGTTWQEVLDNSALSPGLRVVPNNEALLRAKLRACGKTFPSFAWSRLRATSSVSSRC